MGFINKRINLPDPPVIPKIEKIDLASLEDFTRELLETLLKYSVNLADVINGGIKLDENLNVKILTIADSGNADSENTVAHTLKRVPSYFIVVNIDKGGVVYDGGTAWTNTNVYLKCTVANCAIKVLIF